MLEFYQTMTAIGNLSKISNLSGEAAVGLAIDIPSNRPLPLGGSRGLPAAPTKDFPSQLAVPFRNT